jgi:hypothetical protein
MSAITQPTLFIQVGTCYPAWSLHAHDIRAIGARRRTSLRSNSRANWKTSRAAHASSPCKVIGLLVIQYQSHRLQAHVLSPTRPISRSSRSSLLNLPHGIDPDRQLLRTHACEQLSQSLVTGLQTQRSRPAIRTLLFRSRSCLQTRHIAEWTSCAAARGRLIIFSCRMRPTAGRSSCMPAFLSSAASHG